MLLQMRLLALLTPDLNLELFIQKFCCYLTENTLRLPYKEHLIDPTDGNNL
jgi:hypothetical protein